MCIYIVPGSKILCMYVCMHAWYVSVCGYYVFCCVCVQVRSSSLGTPSAAARGTLHHELPAEGSGKLCLAIVHKYT